MLAKDQIMPFPINFDDRPHSHTTV